MKLATANIARARFTNLILEFLAGQGEDVGQVTSNTLNLPFVEDGEEGVLEIVCKVVKKPYDECMQERADYVQHLQEQAEKKAERERIAAEKKAKAEAKRKDAEA